MFFATIWAFLIGKNAVENGIKDAKLNKWSRTHAVEPRTNTYVDAKGVTRDASTNSVISLRRDKYGHLIGTDVFGNDIIDYTMREHEKNLAEAQQNQDPYHTTVKIFSQVGDRFQDVNDPSKQYAIRELHVFNNSRIISDIPVYVDVVTGKIVRPLDEYMEFISHNEYYDCLKKHESHSFPIRDMTIINEMIRQNNETLIDGDFNTNWPFECSYEEVIRDINLTKDYIERSFKNDANDKKVRVLKQQMKDAGKVTFI
ncbi:MAG: hypothetical protein K6F00_11045 [Lachnospiraceae bacterium]|nr:hypothetical protein [Lachnospiraceae bacterium]